MKRSLHCDGKLSQDKTSISFLQRDFASYNNQMSVLVNICSAHYWDILTQHSHCLD